MDESPSWKFIYYNYLKNVNQKMIWENVTVLILTGELQDDPVPLLFPSRISKDRLGVENAVH